MFSLPLVPLFPVAPRHGRRSASPARGHGDGAVGPEAKLSLRGVQGPALLVPQPGKHLLVQQSQPALHFLQVPGGFLFLPEQARAAAHQDRHLVAQAQQHVHFPLPAVLSRHFVFAPPPYVLDERELVPVELEAREQVVELLHREVNDQLVGKRHLQGSRAALVVAPRFGVGGARGGAAIGLGAVAPQRGSGLVCRHLAHPGGGRGARGPGLVVRVVVADMLLPGEAAEELLVPMKGWSGVVRGDSSYCPQLLLLLLDCHLHLHVWSVTQLRGILVF